MAQTSTTTAQETRRANPWVIGLLFGALLLLALPFVGVASGYLDEDVARGLLFGIWAAILLACGATAARFGASGAMAGGIAGGMLAMLLVILQFTRVALRLVRMTYTDIEFTGGRLYTLLGTLVVLVVTVAVGALLGWIGAKLSPSRTA